MTNITDMISVNTKNHSNFFIINGVLFDFNIHYIDILGVNSQDYFGSAGGVVIGDRRLIEFSQMMCGTIEFPRQILSKEHFPPVQPS